MKKRLLACFLAILLLVLPVTGCNKNEKGKNPKLDTSKPVTLKVVGPWESFKAIEAVGEKFSAKYPNCTIEYEYVQQYYTLLEKRLMTNDDPIDLFVTTNIQSDSVLLPYALDLYSDERADLSGTFDGLVQNFTFRGAEGEAAKIYAVPMGAEVRGMYVNKTLLAKYGLKVPTTSEELLEAARVLKENGLISFYGNPGNFAQQLMYPYICSTIANSADYAKTFADVDGRKAGISELFRDAMQFLYTITENGYYDYKYVETELKMFSDVSELGCSRYFLNIVSDGNGGYVKKDDLGMVAFMPNTMSMGRTLEKTKEDYHSEIEYEFILAPVGGDGGYAYLSPAHGVAVNKASEQLDWTLEFLNFLFTPENNKEFAAMHNMTPNTSDAMKDISGLFDIPENHVCELGQVTFSYGFYSLIVASMTEVSKANNPKYMQKDEAGNVTMYPLDYYMARLEAALTGQNG